MVTATKKYLAEMTALLMSSFEANLCKGLTYWEIATELFISEKTVDTHVQHILLKTGVKRKFELLQKLVGTELIP